MFLLYKHIPIVHLLEYSIPILDYSILNLHYLDYIYFALHIHKKNELQQQQRVLLHILFHMNLINMLMFY